MKLGDIEVSDSMVEILLHVLEQEQVEFETCTYCKWYEKECWEEPCKMCKYNCDIYFEPKEQEDE